MLYLDTCVLLAVLTPEAHTGAAVAFLAQATDPMAISPQGPGQPRPIGTKGSRGAPRSAA